MEKKVPKSAIRKHNSIPNDIWIVVDSVVWDISEFAPIHPGGAEVVYKHAGADATQSYNSVHPPSLISSTLPPSKRIGVIDDSTKDDLWNTQIVARRSPETQQTLPDLNTVINSHDFETVASKHLSKRAWAFYSSAATDLITHRANRSFLDRIFFRPRGLVDVSRISVKSTILGNDVSMPLFVSPAALAKLAHPDGELGLARAAVRSGIPICVSTNASYGLEDIVAAAKSVATDGKVANVFFQLYVNKDRSKSERLLRLAERIGVKAIFLTIDAPDRGKREADERIVVDENVHVPMAGVNTGKKSTGGLAKNTGLFIDDTVTWDDIAWIKKYTGLPLLVKGVQSAYDAKKAMEMGLQGIVVGNHGGRCLDTAPPSILTVLEMHRLCPEVFDKLEVFLDGGIRRGTDILKALSLGIKAVGLGRPFLYSMMYGEEGPCHLINILREELVSSVKLVGITNIDQAHPGLVNTLDIDHLVPSTEDHPYVVWKPRANI